MPQFSDTYNAPTCQISTQSGNAWLSYWWFSKFSPQSPSLRHAVTLTFEPWPWTFVVYRVSRDQSLYQILAISNNWLLRYWCFSKFLPSNFKRATSGQFSGVRAWAELYQFLGDTGPSSMLTKSVLDVSYLAPFWNAGGSKAVDGILRQNFALLPPPPL